MKRFLIKLSYTIFPFWLLFVGLTIYYNVHVDPNISGDIGVLGKIPFSTFYSEPVDSLLTDTLYDDVSDMTQLRQKKADMLICGDSFSQQGKKSYQNYLQLMGINVVNFAPPGVVNLNPFQSAYELLDRGLVDSTNVHTLLIESVERSLLLRLATFDPQFRQLDDLSSAITHIEPHQSWSLMEAKNYLMLRLMIKNPVRHAKLNKTLFSGSEGDELYFYKDDVLAWEQHFDEEHEQALYRTLEQLTHKAQEKKVHLLFLICPDKYDLYQKFIIDNPYPAKTVNEELRKLIGSRPDVIIGKEVLMPYLEAGEKDIYMMNDSHWSVLSAKIIAEELRAHLPSPQSAH